MESIPTYEKIPVLENKQELIKMQKTGSYVFHGSARMLDKLTPQQAQNYNGEEMVKDDEPGVFASSEIEMPIFRSIFAPTRYDSHRGNFVTTMEDHDTHVIVKANQEAIDVVRGVSGYVYVFSAKDFVHRRGQEWIAYTTVKPVAVFVSSYDDIEKVEKIN